MARISPFCGFMATIARPFPQLLLRHSLKLEIQGQAQSPPITDGTVSPKTPTSRPMLSTRTRPRTIRSTRLAVVRRSTPDLPTIEPVLAPGKSIVPQLLFRDFPHVSKDVSGQPSIAIKPSRFRFKLNFGIDLAGGSRQPICRNPMSSFKTIG